MEYLAIAALYVLALLDVALVINEDEQRGKI